MCRNNLGSSQFYHGSSENHVMRLILNNPYRTTGLLIGASAKEQEKQIKRLKQYLEAEHEPNDDFSFPVLGVSQRTIDSVTEAASKLHLDNDKMNAALFWFYNGNAITDEPAFESLKDSNINDAIEIWSKLTNSAEVNQRNCSAFQNLSTLLLCNSINGNTINTSLFEKGLTLKLKFLESDFVNNLKEKATDETFKISKKDIQLSFLKALQSEVDRNGSISSTKMIDILSALHFSAKDDFLKGFVEKPLSEIEKKIELAKTKRKSNKANALNAGKELYDSVRNELAQLKNILRENNLKFTSISDKVSDEVLQCGIDYFKYYQDTSTDPGAATMDLFRKANSLAIGNIAKQRCQENTENLQEWIDDKPERDKQKKVLADFEALKNLIDQYEAKSETAANAKQLLLSSRPHLANVKAVLGSTDELYLGLSSRIASDAQGMCVGEINALQERFSNSFDRTAKLTALLILKERVNIAWEVTTLIGSMDLRNDFRNRYNENKNSLSNLRNQLASINTGGSRTGSGSGGSCYIATMAYGDYDHPQVLVLRKFRDEVLTKSKAGNLFINLYYRTSPKLVSLLKGHESINAFIRTILNLFIKLIKS